jgi:hypothetical protein
LARPLPGSRDEITAGRLTLPADGHSVPPDLSRRQRVAGP